MKNTSKAAVLFRMLGLVRPLAGFMVLAVSAGTLGFLAVQFIPVLGASVMLNRLGFRTAFSIKTMWKLLVVFALSRAVLRLTEQRTNHYIAFTLLAIVRDRTFRALRRLSPAKLEGRDKGDLISLITSDVELMEVFYAHTISPVCIAVLTERVMVVYISRYHLSQGLLALAAYLSVGVLLPFLISKKSGNTGEQIRKKTGDLASYVLENIRGLDETLQYSRGGERLDGMNRKTRDLVAKQREMSDITGFNSALSNTFILVFDALMLALSASLYMSGKVGLDGFMIPLVALMSSFGPVSALAGLGTTLQSTVASGARVLDIIDEEPETEEITGGRDITFNGASCEDLTFSYGGEEVIKGLSVEFPEKEILGIVGESGCGKSTLLKLLMRFWKAREGRIALSDTDIEEINTHSLRKAESYMTQDTHLFMDTIANNVRIAKLDATDEEVREACRKASIHDFIMTLPKGYDTQVGELGATLSGGERQRLGLARAFLHDAPFMLLDEPTSNLDVLNEAVILKSLKEEAQEKTVALVSHRKSTVRIADRVFEMKKGKFT